MGPLGLPLSACAAAIVGCLGTGTTERPVDAATIESIDSYCAASWRQANIPRQDWDDCRQQAFIRLLMRVSQDRWAAAIHDAQSRHRRELNRCIWATTQWWRRSHRHRSLSEEDLPDRTNASAFGVTVTEVLEAMHGHAAGLTPIQRCVVDLWASGHSIPEIAARLAVPSRRISDEKYRAIAKLRARFGNC
jgi:DNA-directed RNA polymerase specialized sigma24 family protein